MVVFKFYWNSCIVSSFWLMIDIKMTMMFLSSYVNMNMRFLFSLISFWLNRNSIICILLLSNMFMFILKIWTSMPLYTTLTRIHFNNILFKKRVPINSAHYQEFKSITSISLLLWWVNSLIFQPLIKRNPNYYLEDIFY